MCWLVTMWNADGDPMTISVKVSDDGGKTFGFTVPIEQLSGDVGEWERKTESWPMMV